METTTIKPHPHPDTSDPWVQLGMTVRDLPEVVYCTSMGSTYTLDEMVVQLIRSAR